MTFYPNTVFMSIFVKPVSLYKCKVQTNQFQKVGENKFNMSFYIITLDHVIPDLNDKNISKQATFINYSFVCLLMFSKYH